MDIFQQFENKGRGKFLEFSKTNDRIWAISFSEKRFDSWDVKFFSGLTSFVGEIKNRDIESTKIWPNQPEGFILEKKKYDCLHSHPEETKAFITIFNNELVIWDITKLKPEWIEMKYATTHKRENKRIKVVSYLTLGMATYRYKL